MFTHDAASSDRKDLVKRTISDKTLKDKAYEIAKYDGYQRASMIYKIFEQKKKTGVNEELTQELHEAVIKKFKRRRVYARLKMFGWQI